MRCSDDRDEHPLMTATRWIIIASFWMFGMVGAATAVMALAMGVLEEEAAMESVTCRSCRYRNRCMEYSRMIPCRSYKKWTPAAATARGP